MAAPTRYCDQCKFFIDNDELDERGNHKRPICNKGKRLMFFAPIDGNPYASDWGWKRRCDEFREVEDA